MLLSCWEAEDIADFFMLVLTTTTLDCGSVEGQSIFVKEPIMDVRFSGVGLVGCDDDGVKGLAGDGAVSVVFVGSGMVADRACVTCLGCGMTLAGACAAVAGCEICGSASCEMGGTATAESAALGRGAGVLLWARC